MSSASMPTPLLGGHSLDTRWAPLLGVTVVLNRIGPATLCAIHPETGGLRGFWLDQSTLSDAADWVERHNAAGFNIYFTLNLPQSGLSKKPAKAEIIELRGLAADIDAKNGRSPEEAFAAIGRAGISPNLIIATGGGFQPVWKLPEPLAATTENVRQVEAIGKRIVQLTGSDAVQNIDRIFRLPFTYNFPNEIKRKAGRVVCFSGLLLPKSGGSDGWRDIGMGCLE